ncbi:winged helix-turn-helix domain-containing protein [Streptomyces sp. NBC_01233]|uniref:winged helix-turn-helix domain-containing protein n=1 Tax=Streptomyces sp. NBC_01233 TaxID=2903787 RepID=UPI002E0D5A29|nr:transcriptional regulator [Streptomyces sp. NBC_01233]
MTGGETTGAAGAEGPAGTAEAKRAGHPRHDLAPLLNAPVRLSVVAALVPLDKAEFGFVRDLVEVTDSALSKQVAALEEAGWVAVRKGRVGRRPRTWLSLTPEGRTVYERHLAALRAIALG